MKGLKPGPCSGNVGRAMRQNVGPYPGVCSTVSVGGAKGKETVLHLCLENDAFKAPEHHLDRIWLEPTQVGYFSNPLEPFDAKRPQYLAPEKNSVTREQREQHALEGRADAFTFPPRPSNKESRKDARTREMQSTFQAFAGNLAGWLS